MKEHATNNGAGETQRRLRILVGLADASENEDGNTPHEPELMKLGLIRLRTPEEYCECGHWVASQTNELTPKGDAVLRRIFDVLEELEWTT